MPIYEYECTNCEAVMEFSQSISDEPKTSCPQCSGPLKKLISMSSFQLKGGGWYSDGYSSSNNCDSKCGATPACSTSSNKKSDSKTSCPKEKGTSCACAS